MSIKSEARNPKFEGNPRCLSLLTSAPTGAGGVFKQALRLLGFTRRLVGCFALAGLLSLNLLAADKPNIIYILTDDIGYGDVGCYGATHVKMPNIDRLAKEGRRFTDAHSTASVCTPTRYAFFIPATGDRVPCVFVENHRVVGYDPTDPIRVSYGHRHEWKLGPLNHELL